VKVPYFEPWINHKDKQMVSLALNNRWLTNGKYLKEFESKISKFVKTKYAIGVSNATQALHLSIRSLDIKPNDEIIVPTFTFVATANAVTYCNAKPVFVDVDSKTFNINPMEIKKNITKRTKAIIVVHYGGQSCDMNEIQKIANQHGLLIIEDCAHALGSTYHNKKCGSFGITGCYSFYPTKIITTAEGGMIVTNNRSITNKVRILRSQGMDLQANEREKKAKWKYDIVDLGYNYRMDEMRAALGVSQMKRINEINVLRIKIAKYYNSKIKMIEGLTIPKTSNDRNHIFHLYTIKIEKAYHLSRDELFLKLHKKGIGTSVQYYPLHLMSYIKNKFKIRKNDFPVSNTIKDQIMCLPIFPKMNQKQIDYVIKNLQ